MFTRTTSIEDISKRFATNHFVPWIKFMKTQTSEGKLMIVTLQIDKLKKSVWGINNNFWLTLSSIYTIINWLISRLRSFFNSQYDICAALKCI